MNGLTGALETGFQGGLWVVVAVLLRLMGGKWLPASCRSVLWLLVVVRFLIPAGGGASEVEVGSYVAPQTETVEIERVKLAADPFAVQRAEGVVAFEVPVGGGVDWRMLGVVGWLLGVVLFLVREVVGVVEVRRLVRRGRPVGGGLQEMADGCAVAAGLSRKVPVLVSDGVMRPCLAGWFCPRIVIDETSVRRLTDREWGHVLQHECEHLRRCDPLRMLVGRVTCAFWWWNPLAWVAQRELRRASEEACDAATLRRLGQDERRSYGETVLAIAGGLVRERAPVPTLSMGGGGVRGRIVAISNFSADRGGGAAVVNLVLVGVASFVLAVPVIGETRGGEVIESPYGAGTAGVVDLLEKSRSQGYFGDLNSVVLRGEITRGRAKGVPLDRDRSIEKLFAALEAAPDEPETDWLEFGWDGSRFASIVRFLERDANTTSRLWTGETGRFGNTGRADAPNRWLLTDDFGEVVQTFLPRGQSWFHAIGRDLWWSGESAIHKLLKRRAWTGLEKAVYEPLGLAEFGGELCHVLQCYHRAERLYISEETNLLRGWAVTGSYVPPETDEKYKEEWREMVKTITGQEFEYPSMLNSWLKEQPAERVEEVVIAKAKAAIELWGYSMLKVVRFSDYREIAPGKWLPMKEERAQHLGTMEGMSYCYKTVFRVTDVQVGEGIGGMVERIPPMVVGERVIDHRYGEPIHYAYEEGLDVEALREMEREASERKERSAAGQEQRDSQLELLVGRPMPNLSGGVWLNGVFPDAEARKEKPVLLHFWFTECAPCKNDYPVLRQLKDRYHVVGVHLPTDDVEKVRRAIAEGEMNYPTMIAPASENAMLVARFPVSSFPTCILTDGSGYVTRFGSLEEVLGSGR